MLKKNNKFQMVINKLTLIGVSVVAAIVGLIGILSIFITANLNTQFNFAGERTSFVFMLTIW